MKQFDIMQWLIQKDQRCGRTTWMDIQVLSRDENSWTVSGLLETFPRSLHIDGVAEKVKNLMVYRGNADAKSCVTVPNWENICVMRGVPYSLVFDKNTGFFKTYRYIDGLFGTDGKQLAKHFNAEYRERVFEPESGWLKMPYGTANGIFADVLQWAARTNQEKQRFADDLCQFVVNWGFQRQK